MPTAFIFKWLYIVVGFYISTQAASQLPFRPSTVISGCNIREIVEKWWYKIDPSYLEIRRPRLESKFDRYHICLIVKMWRVPAAAPLSVGDLIPGCSLGGESRCINGNLD